ncbi:MAG: DUF2721 domain-containing protein [Verrucomicrobiota bacterium]
MTLSLNAPALLFPTISLLLLAYTNRFLSLATIVRSLHKEYLGQCDQLILAQINNLRIRLILIKCMQSTGVLSLMTCTLCILLIFMEWERAANVIFLFSLFLMIVSLGFSFWEIHRSTQALEIALSDIETSS